MEIKELKTQYSRRKSFYKKAHVITTDDGEIILRSYTTNVATYNPRTQQLTKLWNGYSRTTMEHIAEFCNQYAIDFTPNKKNWLNLPYDNTPTRYYIKGTNGICYHEVKETIFDNYDDAEEFAQSRSNGFWYFWVEEV